MTPSSLLWRALLLVGAVVVVSSMAPHAPAVLRVEAQLAYCVPAKKINVVHNRWTTNPTHTEEQMIPQNDGCSIGLQSYRASINVIDLTNYYNNDEPALEAQYDKEPFIAVVCNSLRVLETTAGKPGSFISTHHIVDIAPRISWNNMRMWSDFFIFGCAEPPLEMAVMIRLAFAQLQLTGNRTLGDVEDTLLWAALGFCQQTILRSICKRPVRISIEGCGMPYYLRSSLS